MSISLFGSVEKPTENPVVYPDTKTTNDAPKQVVYPMPAEEQRGESSPEAKAEARKRRQN